MGGIHDDVCGAGQEFIPFFGIAFAIIRFCRPAIEDDVFSFLQEFGDCIAEEKRGGIGFRDDPSLLKTSVSLSVKWEIVTPALLASFED